MTHAGPAAGGSNLPGKDFLEAAGAKAESIKHAAEEAVRILQQQAAFGMFADALMHSCRLGAAQLAC